jgi:multidrug efflux pump subunit AcrA (membrane-fusion protein)
VADAEIAVLRAEVVVSEALKLGDVLQDAINDVTAAKNSLANAKWDLDAATAQSALDIRSAQSIADTSEENLRDSYLKWLGIDLTAEEITADPETLYEDWDLVLDEVFSRANLAYGNGIAPDDPSTRWNEFTVFAWLYLHPLAASVAADCGDTLDIELVGKTCVDRSIENAWDTHLDGQDGLNTAISNGPSSVALAENAIFDADQALTDAENELLQVNAGKSEFDVAYAQGALSAAISARDVLVNYPDPIAVALAKAKLLAAQAALSDKMDWPNAFEIELARSEFTKADSLYARLSAGPNPFDEARRDAVLAEASASVEAAEASLGIAITALNNTEIRAPFDGTVSGVDINIGEETSPDDIAMRIANLSSWEIETDDLDELSVVNLREGDIVTVKFDALPDLDMQGTVASISKFGEQKQGSITYKAHITLNDFDPRLRWNMTATISKTDSGVATTLLR